MKLAKRRVLNKQNLELFSKQKLWIVSWRFFWAERGFVVGSEATEILIKKHEVYFRVRKFWINLAPLGSKVNRTPWKPIEVRMKPMDPNESKKFEPWYIYSFYIFFNFRNLITNYTHGNILSKIN